jgi:phosphoglycerate dehydrogenase-like enzyme
MSQRPLVVVTDYSPELGPEKRVLEGVADLELLRTTDEADVIRRAAHVNVMLVFNNIKLSNHAFAHLTQCQGIVRCGVGVDNLAIREAGQRGIVVCNVPDCGTEEVADHALLLLLAVARRLLPLERAVRSGNWDPTIAFGTPRLRGKTLGLVGCGRIGSALALRAKALGVRVVFYDPYQPDGLDKALGIERCDRLCDLLPQSQFLSLHCPLSTDTYHLLNAETLSQLPKGAYVINTARGPCLELDALLAALESGQLAGAGLDVVEREPLDHERIRQHPRIVFTPHTAYYSVEGYAEVRIKGAEEARRILLREPVLNPVNLTWLTKPRCPVGLTRRSLSSCRSDGLFP